MLRSKEPEGTNTPPDPKLKYLWQFLKSEGGRILVVILIFVGLVLMIPLLYLKGILLGWIAPFSTVFPTADDPESYYLIAEFGAWQAVLVTGFVILMANTFYYVITLFSDLNANDPNRETPRWPFRVVGICLISLIFAFFLFGVHVGLKRSEFATFLEIQSAKLIESQNDGTRSHNKRLTPNSAGTQLRNGITNRFHEIVTNTEYFTLGVFILFVVMDLISYKGKNDQIKVVGIQQRKSLALEKNAISQQLLLIGFSCLLGDIPELIVHEQRGLFPAQVFINLFICGRYFVDAHNLLPMRVHGRHGNHVPSALPVEKSEEATGKYSDSGQHG